MNTTTESSSVVAPATSVSSIVNPVGPINESIIEQEITSLRAKLEEAEHRKQILAQEAADTLKGKIASVLEILGVKTVQEGIAILISKQKGEGGSERPVLSAIERASERRGKHETRRLPDSTVKQMRAMIVSGATARLIAGTLKVGVSTVDNYKKKWGLTRKRSNSRDNNHRMTPAVRAKIVAALLKPNANIAQIAEKYGFSRPSIYNLKNGLNKYVTSLAGHHSVAA